jgi:hypothetical protein
MAIVKANYTKSAKAAQATIGYIAERPDREGKRGERTLFGADGAMEQDLAKRMIRQAPRGTHFFRLVISPDRLREDTGRDLNLREVTLQTILRLEERLGKRVRFVAAEHDDHTPNRHVHVVALLSGRLTHEDLAALRTAATASCLTQRRERDLARQARGKWQYIFVPRATKLAVLQRRRFGTFRSVTMRPTCPRCLSQQTLKKLYGARYRCPSCGYRTSLSLPLEHMREEASWGRR